jgi:hypothetical protein
MIPKSNARYCYLNDHASFFLILLALGLESSFGTVNLLLTALGLCVLGYNRSYITVLAGSGDRLPGICHKYREAATLLLTFPAEGKVSALFRGKSGRFLIRNI